MSNSYNIIINNDNDNKIDNRLFPGYPLYCEGLNKPLLRGIFHLIPTIFLPFGLWHLIRESNNNIISIIAVFIYITTNILCYGLSALYHIGRWSIQTEILLQKLDHCGIAMLSVGTFIPTTLLLLSPIVSISFLITLISLLIWTCYNIFNLRPSVLRQISIPLSSLPFLLIQTIIYNDDNGYTRTEWILYCIVVFFKILSLAVFVNTWPNPFPKTFGYHEIFHILVVLAGTTIYMTNWNIVRRVCNPYHHNNDVIIIILKKFFLYDIK